MRLIVRRVINHTPINMFPLLSEHYEYIINLANQNVIEYHLRKTPRASLSRYQMLISTQQITPRKMAEILQKIFWNKYSQKKISVLY